MPTDRLLPMPIYKTVDPDTVEGKYIADMRNSVKKIRDAFMEGVTAASEKNSLHEKQDGVKSVKYSGRVISNKDSAGNELSAEQQEYFKDSKVRDAEGNLLVVYHGSPSKFTVFDHRKLNTHGNAHGRGFYFTETKGLAESYSKADGQLLEGYLDIKNPMSEERVTIKRSALVRLIKESCKEQAKSLVADEGYSSTIEALRDTWVSNYVMTYGMSMDEVYQEVADIIYDSSDNDVDIIAEMTNAGAGNEATLRLTRKILGYDGVIYTNEAYGGHEFVAFESNQFKKIDNKTPTVNPDIRYSARKGTSQLRIDNLTAKQYNYFGWARANDVMTAEEYSNFETEFSKAITSKEYDSYKSSANEYMIAVGALYGENEGVKRKIVFARGTIEEPIITRIVEIDADNETELSDERKRIYEIERRGIRTKAKGILRLYTRFDVRDFATFQRNNDSNTRNNNQLGINRGTSSSGTQKAESGIRNSIAPIAETFTDVTGKSRKVRRLGKQYMVEGTKKRNYLYDTIQEAIEAENAYLESKKVKHSGRNRITPEMDASYLDAVNRGDMKTAQRLVDEAAKEAGYTVKAYHGTSAKFNTFKQGEKNGWLGKGIYFAENRSYAKENGKRIITAYLNQDELYTSERNNHFGVFSELQEKFPQINEFNIAEVLAAEGYEGVSYTDWDKGKIYSMFLPENIKSADPITYDDNGNVIPLSERFNSANNDIRYSSRAKYTAGQMAQTKANLSHSKVYTKESAMKLVKELAPNIRNRSFEVLSNELWRGLNTYVTLDDKTEFARDMAQQFIDRMMVDTLEKNPAWEEATEKIAYIKIGINRLSFMPDELTELDHILD